MDLGRNHTIISQFCWPVEAFNLFNTPLFQG
jgi:hypothetical protein